uniref:Uncharacterized protein n=1 Tax=Arundo donax TaxID=35708 RepID=A0A0A8ZA21_ARUDO
MAKFMCSSADLGIHHIPSVLLSHIVPILFLVWCSAMYKRISD